MLRVSFSAMILGLVFVSPSIAQEPGEQASILEGRSADMINMLHQREWVRLDDRGGIAGTLMTLTTDGSREARVAATIVISKDGESIVETKSDASGRFTLEGLKPGTYALQARGDVTFAAFALHVLPAGADHLSSNLDVYASVIPAADATRLISADVAPADWDAGQDVYYRVHRQDPIAEQRKFNDSHQVVLRNGDLVGRVSRPGWTYAEQDLSGGIAQIVRDGEVIRKAPIGRDGYYVVKNLNPGVYDLFVTGDDGYAVVAFQAVRGSQQKTVASTPFEGAAKFVSTEVGAPQLVSTDVGMVSDCLCTEMIQPPEITACSTCSEEIIIEEEIIAIDECGCGLDPCLCEAPAPCCGGGMVGGGGFYGGGGGGGFGGFGGAGILGAAGLAIGVAALADDDDDDFFRRPITPPFVPPVATPVFYY